MESHFKLLGHPVHPILVNLPIGSYIGSLIFDLVYLWRGDPLWYEMAFWLMGIGIIGHVSAAGSGLVDFFALSKDRTAAAYPTARLHLIIGAVLLAVYLVNFYLRWSTGLPPHSSSRWPILLSLIGNGILGVQGWLGGELVYRHGVGVEKH